MADEMNENDGDIQELFRSARVHFAPDEEYKARLRRMVPQAVEGRYGQREGAARRPAGGGALGSTSTLTSKARGGRHDR